MTFIQAVQSGFSNYVNFCGRSARSEYWFWILFVGIGEAVGVGLDYAIFAAPPRGYSITSLPSRYSCQALPWRSGDFTI